MTDAVPATVSSDHPAAFESLMRTYYAKLCDFTVGQVHSRDVAEDIVQDVFAQLWQQWDTITLRDPLPYLYQAVRNRVVSHRRRMGVREHWRQYVTTLADRPSVTTTTAAAEAEAEDLAAAYAQALQRLPERCRLIFTMSREQTLTYDEIARALGISVKTVETQIGRALKALRHRLRPYLCLAAAAAWGSQLLG